MPATDYNSITRAVGEIVHAIPEATYNAEKKGRFVVEDLLQAGYHLREKPFEVTIELLAQTMRVDLDSMFFFVSNYENVFGSAIIRDQFKNKDEGHVEGDIVIRVEEFIKALFENRAMIENFMNLDAAGGSSEIDSPLMMDVRETASQYIRTCSENGTLERRSRGNLELPEFTEGVDLAEPFGMDRSTFTEELDEDDYIDDDDDPFAPNPPKVPDYGEGSNFPLFIDINRPAEERETISFMVNGSDAVKIFDAMLDKSASLSISFPSVTSRVSGDE